MNSPARFNFRLGALSRVLLLGGLILFAAGCATMSHAKIGISGTNDSGHPAGR